MTKLLPRIRDRIISDFLMDSRLGDYRRLLEAALEAGYRVSSVGSIWQTIEERGLAPSQRHFVLRHDVDTDPRTAAAMWEIDRDLGISSSYFFRLSTLAPELMTKIASAGGEASYHYEELATVVKRLGLRSREDAVRHLPEARARFAENIAKLRILTGLSMRVVASHGDFVNARLGAPNWLILADASLRRELDIDLETYDGVLLRHLPTRITDNQYPRFWDPRDPGDVIHAGEPIISLLVHPRHWRVDRIGNTRDDIGRAIEGVRFALASSPRRRA